MNGPFYAYPGYDEDDDDTVDVPSPPPPPSEPEPESEEYLKKQRDDMLRSVFSEDD